LQEAVLALVVLKFFLSAGQFILQVPLMAEERGDAETIDFTEGLKGMVFGQEGEVDILALGMVAGFALHGFLRK
jgi:hypothetical protein